MTLPPMMLTSPARFAAVDARIDLPDDLSALGTGTTLSVVGIGDDGTEHGGTADVAFADGVLTLSNIELRANAWRNGAAAALIAIVEGEAWARLATGVRVDLRSVEPADRERHERLLAQWGYEAVSAGVIERDFAAVRTLA
jgi:prepilin-type processing-associated H-X9-DG protein